MSDIAAVWTQTAVADAQHRARLNSILTRPAPAPPKQRPAAPVAQADELPPHWWLCWSPLWVMSMLPIPDIEEHDSGDTAAPVTGQPAWLKPIPVKPVQKKRRLSFAQLEAVLSVTHKDRGSPEAYRAALAKVGKPAPPKRKPKAAAVSAA